MSDKKTKADLYLSAHEAAVDTLRRTDGLVGTEHGLATAALESFNAGGWGPEDWTDWRNWFNQSREKMEMLGRMELDSAKAAAAKEKAAEAPSVVAPAKN